MKKIFISRELSVVLLLLICTLFFGAGYDNLLENKAEKSQRVHQVSEMNGLIAFWDFSQKKDGLWTSIYDEKTVDTDFQIVLRRIGDEQAYSQKTWPYKDKDSKLVFDKSGPFGNAVRFNQGYIFGEVPRSEFEKTPLNINGNKPFTLIAWSKFVGERHFVTGIWDEGGWDKYRGRRQYALFGGLFNSMGTTAHVSATGASSYPQSTIEGSQYARKRAIDGHDFKNDQWVAMAMTFDPATKLVTAFLDGDSTKTHITDPVANDVFQFDQPVSSNPFYFPWKIFSPKSFVLKFNGYDFQSSGVYEHWLEINTDSFAIKYGQNSDEELTKKQEYKVRLDVRRDGESILSSPLEQVVTETKELFGPNNKSIKIGDTILTTLYQQQNNKWQKIGSTVNYQVRDGAPFTFGRALGLGNESIDEGSQLFIDGVAVFDRILSNEELENLSFKN